MFGSEGCSNEGHLPALYSEEPADRQTFLKRAADDGHVPAMVQLGILCEDPQERRYWRRQAAQHGRHNTDVEN